MRAMQSVLVATVLRHVAVHRLRTAACAVLWPRWASSMLQSTAPSSAALQVPVFAFVVHDSVQ